MKERKMTPEHARDRMRDAAAKKAEKELLRLEREKKKREHLCLRAERTAQRNRRAAEKSARRAAVYRRLRKALKNGRYAFADGNFGFLPRVGMTVRGDCASAAERLASAGIEVICPVREGACVRFKIRKKDLRRAIAILREMCYTYEVNETYGAGRTMAFLLSRIGLAAGVAASAVCLHILYSHIWQVRIYAGDRVSASVIERALGDIGARRGVRKRDISTDGVASAVSELDGVSDASAEISGTTLRVYVLGSDDHAERKDYAGYGALYDATVTRIVMRSGSAKVRRGDTVKRGDILADGCVYSTAGELMYTGACDADIYGEVAITFAAELSDTYVAYERTGRRDRQTVFSLFGFELGRVSPPYDSYDTVARTARYDVLLPLYVTVYEFFETAPVDRTTDPDGAAKAFAADKAEELGFIGDFGSSYTVKPTGYGLYRVNVFLSGEALISGGLDSLPVLPDGDAHG